MAKSNRETAPQSWSSDSERAIAETSAGALDYVHVFASDDRKVVAVTALAYHRS